MSFLYTLLIYPLELFFEVVFSISNRIVGHPGFAIIILSLAVNFLVLPLYFHADKLQKEQNEKKRALQPWIRRIRKTFSGDERVMILQAYYRENDYKPSDIFKESFSLLLQIPFFIAAYRFLSNLGAIKGVSFGPIENLGAPDRMFVIAGFGINILPIVMTLINIVSGYIYTKGLPLKTRIQLYAIAVFFLIFLYNSPSGLVFYWTLNNLFSMVKNIFYRFKKPGLVFSVLLAVTGAAVAVYTNTGYDTPFVSRKIRLTAMGIVMVIPLIVTLIRHRFGFHFPGRLKIPSYNRKDRDIFTACGILLSILTGALIPSSVVKTSPDEFMDLMNLKNPLIYVLNSTLIAAGFFLVWGGVFFFLSGEKARVVLSRIWLALCPAGIVSYLFFGTDLGDISVNFVYIIPFEFTASQKIVNLLVVLLSASAVLLLYRFLPGAAEGGLIALILVSVVMCVTYFIPVNRAYKDNLSRLQNEYPSFILSAEGRNVMVLMLDRAPSYLVPIIFEELPYLYEQFDGFTFYPNTISFGNRTKFAAPALFGGYDYTPAAINADSGKTLAQKQNEALSVMPVMFRDEGYSVTLLDPPFAGYKTPGDIGVFTGPLYEGIKAYHAKTVMVDSYYKFEEIQDGIWRRNFFCYSIFKISPLYIQATVYDEGRYNQPQETFNPEEGFTMPQTGFDRSSSWGVETGFMSSYEFLNSLPEITVVSGDSGNTFMYLDNDTAHDVMLLQTPDYIPYQYVDNHAYDEAHEARFDDPVNGYYLDMSTYNNMKHYSGNAAAYIGLGRYFDYLREMGVWDNTRIIIVADHGIANTEANMFGGQLDMGSMCIDAYNPVLMVKDFGDSGFKTDYSFMTNADVPYLAVRGLIDDPVNPFTGTPITPEGVHDMPLEIIDSNDWMKAGGDDYKFAEDDWYLFNGDTVIDPDSWEYDGVR